MLILKLARIERNGEREDPVGKLNYKEVKRNVKESRNGKD